MSPVDISSPLFSIDGEEIYCIACGVSARSSSEVAETARSLDEFLSSIADRSLDIFELIEIFRG